MNSNPHIISSTELFEKIGQDHSTNKFKTAGKLLLEAINDWPTFNLSEPKDLLTELNSAIGAPLTFGRIKRYSDALKVESSAWKMEATSSLLEIFEYDKTKALDQIIVEISEYYNLK